MRFSLKLVLCTTVITALLFSVCGTLMVKENFDRSLELAVKQNVNQHTLERYALESNMLGYILSGEEFTDEKLAEYGYRLSGYAGTKSQRIAIYTEDRQEIFSNLPEGLTREAVAGVLGTNGDDYQLEKAGQEIYMLLASYLNIENHPVYVASAYDMTSVFTERDRQLRTFLILNGIIIAISLFAIFLLSMLLTAPIKKLNTASRKIAKGAYSERTHIHSQDEIGELSRSFDQMAQAVEDKIEALNAALKQREDFISSFSHEIKTPMTAIIGYADMMRLTPCEKDTQLKYANYIYSESKRLEELSRKLMDLMALSEEPAVLEPVDTGMLFYRLKKQLEPALGEITLEIEAEDATVLAEETLLNCLIRNLVVNAKKADPKDGQVHIKGTIEGSRYGVCVTDKGCGIPKEKLSRIVEPFYMVDKSRARACGGAGMGLAICQKIAELHGTKLEFESVLGEGTSVRFLLRCWKGEEEGDATQA